MTRWVTPIMHILYHRTFIISRAFLRAFLRASNSYPNVDGLMVAWHLECHILVSYFFCQWAHVYELLMWILIYSYDINWLIASTPYPGRLILVDGLCDRRVRTRVRAHGFIDGFAGSLVYQY